VYLPDVVVHHHPSPQRDPGQRRLRESRNRIWTAWMRRSIGDAARRTVVELRAATRQRAVAALCRMAARGVPMIIAGRRRLSRTTEALLRDVEQ
jgi:hypothetical protein